MERLVARIGPRMIANLASLSIGVGSQNPESGDCKMKMDSCEPKFQYSFLET
jgi:hypothetical protein